MTLIEDSHRYHADNSDNSGHRCRATLPVGQTIQNRWGGVPGALTPIQTVPSADYLPNLVISLSNSKKDVTFTAVGYGTGENVPIPGKVGDAQDVQACTNTTFGQ
jgi:hypothetical protein